MLHLEEIVAAEQEKLVEAKPKGMFNKSGVNTNEFLSILATEAFEKVEYKFEKYLQAFAETIGVRKIVVLPKLLAKDSFTGNSTIIKEMIYAMRGETSHGYYLLEQLVARDNSFLNINVKFWDLVKYKQDKFTINDNELFWLFMLCESLKITTDKMLKVTKARFFEKTNLLELCWNKPIVSGSSDEKDSDFDTLVKEQYAALEAFLKELE